LHRLYVLKTAGEGVGPGYPPSKEASLPLDDPAIT